MNTDGRVIELRIGSPRLNPEKRAKKNNPMNYWPQFSLILLLLLTACSAKHPVSQPFPPAPPQIEKDTTINIQKPLPKALPKLRAGDWIIEKPACNQDDKVCVCHNPRERIEVKSRQDHKIVECR